LLEAVSTINQEERSLRDKRAPDATGQLHSWRRKRFDILQQISRRQIESEHD
jgi:hypothetical protein